jgi:hypothetical protein
MTAALARTEPTDLPMLSTAQVLHRLDGINDLMSKAMVPAVDYGSIPGTGGKPTLLKPGAEKLCVLFQFAPAYRTEKTYHPDGHLTVECVCTIHHAPTGGRLGEAAAMCTTRESKYAYRGGARVCPECGKPAIKKSKFPPRDDPNGQPGFYCYGKVGGCGVNFAADDERVTSQPEGRVPNPDLADAYNTVLRIAEKRALVAAVRLVTGASAIFDEEQGEHDDAPAESPARPSASKPQAPPPVDRAKVAAAIIAAIGQADSLADLTTLWKALPAPKGFLAVKDEHTAAVVAAKDARKAALSQPAPALDQLKDEIDDLCQQLSFDTLKLTLAEQACGIDDPAAITDVQAAKLVAYLRHELKGIVPV